MSNAFSKQSSRIFHLNLVFLILFFNLPQIFFIEFNVLKRNFSFLNLPLIFYIKFAALTFCTRLELCFLFFNLPPIFYIKFNVLKDNFSFLNPPPIFYITFNGMKRILDFVLKETFTNLNFVLLNFEVFLAPILKKYQSYFQ